MNLLGQEPTWTQLTRTEPTRTRNSLNMNLPGQNLTGQEPTRTDLPAGTYLDPGSRSRPGSGLRQMCQTTKTPQWVKVYGTKWTECVWRKSVCSRCCSGRGLRQECNICSRGRPRPLQTFAVIRKFPSVSHEEGSW